MPAGAGSDASARGGDHEQPRLPSHWPVTTALEWSRGREEQQEVEHVTKRRPAGHRTLHLRGTRPEQLCLQLRGRRRQSRSVTWLPGLLVVAPVVHDGLDEATLQYLLQQSLLAVAVEEEEAKEVAKLSELEEQVAVQEQLVLEELNRLARLRDKTNLSHLLGRR